MKFLTTPIVVKETKLPLAPISDKSLLYNNDLTDVFIVKTFANSSAVFSSGVWGVDITVTVPTGYTVIGAISTTMSRLQGLSLTITEYKENPSRYHLGGYNDGAERSGSVSVTLAMVKTSLCGEVDYN